ncbi:sugar ABC transporter substrate-binding protein [Pusillimonas sp. MFBS29]|uniref:sugar ABC transporter substrate-binding protein n=1 Tax=Pusillimonas sp. MFBS29 TaxID=2886690 RepID=UPI001D12457D|nr:sugar ABC transporter substrate-binding protein [Pusillimonas sp. MFBS29]MCC2596841.1 sugar ABC transporter substrate-binding protein [Pusillimonas sp. MFBS29]
MKLAVFTKNKTNPAYAGARLGADRAAQRYGVQALHFVPQEPDSVAQQIELIDEALALKPDAFVISPVHPTKINSAIQRVHQAAIPIVALVSPIESVPCVSFVNSDDYNLALEIAGYLYQKMSEKGKVLIISGHVDSSTSLDRLRGFHDAARAFPNITLIDTVIGDYVRPTAYVNSKKWFAANEETQIDACLVANDIMALGVIDALRETHRNALVVGVNAIPEAIPALKNGSLLATADFNAMRMAYLATEIAIRHLRGESMPRRVQLPVEIINRDNIHQYDLPYEDRSTPTLDEVLART